MFAMDKKLLATAAAALSEIEGLYWVLGGACAGKSTVCRALAAGGGVDVYDMDAQIFGGFMGRYEPDRHPACLAWFGAANPLQWALSLSPVDFDQLNRAADVEYIDLLVAELIGNPLRRPLLIDGGVTHPAVVSQVLPPARIVCLWLPPEVSARIWEEDPQREGMKKLVQELPAPEHPWQIFLERDRQIAETILWESRSTGIRVVEREREMEVAELATIVAGHFNLPVPLSAV